MSNGTAESSSCKKNEQEIDRVSHLPDSVLVHILSLLPTKDAVKTVLIRRFGNLWTSIHNIDFNVCTHHRCEDVGFDDEDRDGLTYDKRLMNLIRHVLILHERSDIHRFSLRFEINFRFSADEGIRDDPEVQGIIGKEMRLANEIETWIRFAVRKRVKVLDLDFKACGYFGPEYYCKLPNAVLSSDSLTELKLVCCRVAPRGEIHMRSLKTLSFEHILLRDETMAGILSGCPLLENLLIIGCYGLHKLNFTSENLKNLMVVLGTDVRSRLEISCPYVTSLDISGWIERVDLKNVSSHIDATLNFNGNFSCARDEYLKVKMLLEKFHHAKIFTMFSSSILVLTIWELMNLPCPSTSWKCLVLKTKLTKWHLPGIASLLRNSPNLEMLDIHIFPCNIPFCLPANSWLRQHEFDGENFWNHSNSPSIVLQATSRSSEYSAL